MQLILQRNGAPVDHPPFWAGANFYYAEGMIGISAQEGWTFTQQLLAEGEDGEPVVTGTVHWSVVAAPPLPEPEPPTQAEIRAAMPTLSPPQIRILLIQVLGIQPEPDNDDLLDLLNKRIAAAIASIPDPMDRAKARIYWETAQFYERSNPLVDLVGALTDPPLPPEDIDVAWLSAVGAPA